MKTAKQLRTGLVGEGEFIPNAASVPAPVLVGLNAELAQLREAVYERDEIIAIMTDTFVELSDALKALMLVAEYKDMKSGETVGSLFPLRFNKARAVLDRTNPKS